MEKRNKGIVLLEMLECKKDLHFDDKLEAVKTGNVWIYLEEHYQYIKNKLGNGNEAAAN